MTTPTTTKNEKTLVSLTESGMLRFDRSFGRLSLRKDPSYFTGRAGIVRVACLIIAAFAVALMTTGYNPGQPDGEIIMAMKNKVFSGYRISSWTLSSIVFGGCTVAISTLFILLLYFFLEVRCELIWEKINQKAHVLTCILSVAAAFCDVMSIQKIQEFNCNTLRCQEEKYNTRNLKFEEVYYPPYFVYHYASFVLFLINAMLYSIASRIWLRNDDS